jgi:chorismate dehydratase
MVRDRGFGDLLEWIEMGKASVGGQPRLRLGAVSYLNTKPLVFGLAQRAPQIEIVYDVPSRLADDLHRGRLDVALIPSIEYSRNPSFAQVSDACIGCRGPVLSVKLFSRKPLPTIRSLALDEGSRTSVLLAQILLWERYRLRPRLSQLSIDGGPEDTAADAVLLIGDRAIHPPQSGFVDCWDLGDQWCRWSELPFVFALWVARPGVDLSGLDEILGQTRDSGVAHLEQIAQTEAAGVGLSPSQTLSYLRDNLYFYFHSRERRGMELFFELAAQLETLPAEQESAV